MPTYQYRCDDCRHTFTVVESIDSHRKPAACPKCRSRRTQQVLSPSYVKTIKKS